MTTEDIPPPSDADAPWMGAADHSAFAGSNGSGNGAGGNGNGRVLPFRAPASLKRVSDSNHLPHNLDCEASVLGSVLLRNETLKLLAKLEVDDFYDPRHKSVFGAMRNLEARGAPIDLITLEAELVKMGKLESLGGIAFLGELALRVPTTDNVVHYAAIVSEHSGARAAMLSAAATVGEIQRGSLSTRDAAEELIGALQRILEQKVVTAPPPEPGSDGALFAQALVDVKTALSMATVETIKLLFEPAIGLFTSEYPPTAWLARGLVIEGGVTIVGGIPKEAFKTWVLVEMAVAIATGTPVFGVFETGEPKVVAYFFAEDLKRSVRNRFRASAEGRGMTAERISTNLHIEPRGRFLDLLRDEDMALIVASCRKIGKVDVLILEPLRDLHSGEEDSSDSMREVMRRLRLLGELIGCTPMVAHHAGKGGADSKGRGGGQSLRGSGSIHGSVDNGIYLRPVEGDGDGESQFKNRVESQVKGAKSAGFFDLELSIEDDAEGEAIRASWKFEKTGKVDPAVAKKNDARANAQLERERTDRERWELVRALAELDTPTSPAGFISSAVIWKRLGVSESTAANVLRSFEKRGLLVKAKGNRGYQLKPTEGS